MKPESADFIAKSHRMLREASAILDIGLFEAAGRTGYLAGFHAAQALIFERTERVVKTHNGVHSEFARLMKGDLQFPAELRSFLARTYELKSIADYGVGASADVTAEESSDAIMTAERLLAFIEAKLAL